MPVAHNPKLKSMPVTAQYYTVNIGPGPNSTACLIVDGVTLSPKEIEIFKSLLEDEEDDRLRHVCEFIMATRGGDLRVAGAHHEIDTFEAEDTPGNEIDYQACLFCGDKYRWAIRCSGNPEGLV